MKRTRKIVNLLAQIHACVAEEHYKDTSHSILRKRERKIGLVDILYVLKHGFHEERKDHYHEGFQSWNYAIRGKTIDGREIRVIVSFDSDGLLIITAMVVCQERR